MCFLITLHKRNVKTEVTGLLKCNMKLVIMPLLTPCDKARMPKKKMLKKHESLTFIRRDKEKKYRRSREVSLSSSHNRVFYEGVGCCSAGRGVAGRVSRPHKDGRYAVSCFPGRAGKYGRVCESA